MTRAHRYGFAAAALALALTLTLAACGDKSDITSGAKAGLTPLVERVRRAAEAHDLPGAQRALVQLVGAVNDDEKHGDVSATRGAQIVAAANGVEGHLGLLQPPTTTTTTTTTVPPTTTEPSPRGHGHGHDKHKDHGNGDNGND